MFWWSVGEVKFSEIQWGVSLMGERGNFKSSGGLGFKGELKIQGRGRSNNFIPVQSNW